MGLNNNYQPQPRVKISEHICTLNCTGVSISWTWRCDLFGEGRVFHTWGSAGITKDYEEHTSQLLSSSSSSCCSCQNQRLWLSRKQKSCPVACVNLLQSAAITWQGNSSTLMRCPQIYVPGVFVSWCDMRWEASCIAGMPPSVPLCFQVFPDAQRNRCKIPLELSPKQIFDPNDLYQCKLTLQYTCLQITWNVPLWILCILYKSNGI